MLVNWDAVSWAACGAIAAAVAGGWIARLLLRHRARLRLEEIYETIRKRAQAAHEAPIGKVALPLLQLMQTVREQLLLGRLGELQRHFDRIEDALGKAPGLPAGTWPQPSGGHVITSSVTVQEARGETRGPDLPTANALLKTVADEFWDLWRDKPVVMAELAAVSRSLGAP